MDSNVINPKLLNIYNICIEIIKVLFYTKNEGKIAEIIINNKK